MAPEPRSVFVSYAHADNEPSGADRRGWVTSWAQAVERRLRMMVAAGRSSLVVDHDLPHHEPLADGLHRSLTECEALVAILSPNYLQSEWCRRELDAFLESQARRGMAPKLLGFEILPTEIGSWPVALQDRPALRLWTKDSEGAAPVLLGYPWPPGDSADPYWLRINESAHQIALCLADEGAASSSMGRAVWIAETTADLVESRRGLASAFQQQGWDVLPHRPYSRADEESYRAEVRADLRCAHLAVQLLGPESGEQSGWRSGSWVAVQAAEADLAAKERDLPLRRWRPRGLDPAGVLDPALRGLLLSPEVLSCGVAELEQELFRLAESKGEPVQPSTPPASSAPQVVEHIRSRLALPATPYPGLRSFEGPEAAVFYGRETHVERLLEILERERFLAVLGPSGAGKSSLVRAGLLPTLQHHRTAGAAWRVATLRPGDRPFSRLAASLLAEEALGPTLAGPDGTDFPTGLLEAELRRGPLGLAHLVADARRMSGEPFLLLVLVDQFEELFRYAHVGTEQADESDAFVNLLLAARAEPDTGVAVALTMRTEFLGECVRFLELPEVINRAQYLTPRLRREELARAITGPAQCYGASVAPALVTELINALGQALDQLPLLQHALARMWSLEGKEGGRHRLTLESLEHLGGVEGALSAHAEELFARLDVGQQALAEGLFRAITVREGSGETARSTRRPLQLDRIAFEAQSQWEELVPIVRLFAQEGANFLHAPGELAPDTVIDISHEAFIRQWGRLRVWANDEAERAAEYRRLRDRADQWVAGGELLTGADLARGLEWQQGRDGWRPSPRWASRYGDGSPQADPDATFTYITESQEAETARIEEKLEAVRREEELKLEALRAKAETEAGRARAARRQRTLAVIAASVACALTGLAYWFKTRADAKAGEALARQLLGTAASLAPEESDRAQLLTVEAFAASRMPASEMAVRREFVAQESLVASLCDHEGGATQALVTAHGDIVFTASQNGFKQSWDARLWYPNAGRRNVLLADQSELVYAASLSPDGALLGTGGRAGILRLWDATTGLPVGQLEDNAGQILTIAFHPTEPLVATGGVDGVVRVWNTHTKSRVLSLRIPRSFVNHLAFSRAGDRLAAACSDGTARVWDSMSWRQLAEFPGHEDVITDLALSSDGQTLATTSIGGVVRLWNVEEPTASAGPKVLDGRANGVAFSPNGRWLATSGHKGGKHVWDPGSGQKYRSLSVDDDDYGAVVFSPDGELLFTASDSGRLTLWSTSTFQPLELSQKGHRGRVVRASFSSDGTRIVTAGDDGCVRLWDPVAGRPLLTAGTLEGGASYRYRLAPGMEAATIIGRSDRVTVRNLRTGETTWSVEPRSGIVTQALVSSDGRTLALSLQDGTVWLGEWPRTQAVPVPEASGSLLGLDPAGQILVVRAPDHSLLLIDVATKTVRARLTGHERQVGGVAFDRDGGRFATIGNDGTARVWHARTGRAIAAIVSDKYVTTVASFSPNGEILAVAGGEGTVRLWKVPSGELAGELKGHTDTVWDVSFSPDGERVLSASADLTARVWSTASGQCLSVLPDHKLSARSARFSSDGRTIVTTSYDSTARLWDSSTGQALTALKGARGQLSEADFASGDRLVVALGEGLAVWPCSVCRPTEELAEAIRRRVGRSLTAEERVQSGLPSE